MRLFTRSIPIFKTADEVYRTIKSCQYHATKGRWEKDCFTIYCAKRFKGSVISLIPVKGTISTKNSNIVVVLSIYANLGFYIGCLLFVTGAIGLLSHVIAGSPRWIPGLGSIVIGMLISGQVLWEAKNTLDMIERKLQN